MSDAHASEGGARVPEELREAWAAKQDLIVSEDGTRIDFHGGGIDVWHPRHLSGTELKRVTDTFVVSLVHQIVTSVNVTRCESLTDESIKAIAKACPKLKELKVYFLKSLTDSSIKAIAEGCPELKELDVSCCYDLSDSSIKAIAKGCPQLKELNVHNIGNLTDESMKAIAQGCPELKELNVHDIENLTDESMKAIANGCPELKELNVHDIENLTDESMKAIAKGCPELKELNVSVSLGLSSNLTDQSMKAIAKGCPKLKELNMCNRENLTDESIKAIAQGCPELKKLRVAGCTLGDSWLKAICEGCPGLEVLDASLCGLGSIPEELGDCLLHLQDLDIRWNSVSRLPSSICKLKDLRILNVDTSLQSPPYEIAKQGLHAIQRYFEELKKGSSVSKLLKVVLVGDGEAGKTTLRNALAGRPNPRQEDRTIHLDIEKITLNDDLDINVYDCGGQEEYLATQLPYLTGLALYVVVVDAQYATDEHAHDLHDKLHRFLVILQNRVPGAVVLPIVTKVDTVEDAERRRHWLESTIEKWLQDTREAVCGDLPKSSAGRLQPSASGADNIGNRDRRTFFPLRVQLPALAVSVADIDDEQAVRDSIRPVRESIIALTKYSPPLLRGVGQHIPSTYVAVLELFGAIAELGDNGRALQALRNGTARALGETSKLSPGGTYRPRDELKKIWDTYRADPKVSVKGTAFDEATQLWEAQGRVFVDAGLVVLQPEFVTKIVKPLVDHRHTCEEQCEGVKADVAKFIKASSSYDNDNYKHLIHALDIFRDSGEIETCSESPVLSFLSRYIGFVEMEASLKSPLLSFLWRDAGLDTRHYGQVLEMLATSGVIINMDNDLSQKRIVVLYRLPGHSSEEKLRASWPPQSMERELRIRFEAVSGFPAGLAERFAADVHGIGMSLYAWRSGVVVSRAAAGYRARAERIGGALVFTVRFKTQSVDAAWKALCDAQHMLQAQRFRRFPGLFYTEVLICEQCWREGKESSAAMFDAKQKEFEFIPCGHRLALFMNGQEEKSDSQNVYYKYISYNFAGTVIGGQFVGVTEGDANYHG